MDIAYFISDLLGQQGQLSVPNLGHFAQVRMPAFYDNRTKQFLPPHYAIKFEPVTDNDDDALAEYISASKKISVSSAKYFIEKYTSNLKNQSVGQQAELHNLGTFSSDGTKLTFNAFNNNDDPAFFAYTPVDAYRIGDAAKKPVAANERTTVTALETSAVAKATEIMPEPVEAQIAGAAQNGTETEEAAYESGPRGIATWMIVVCAVLVLFIVLGGLYKYKPELFQQFSANNPVIENHADPIIKKDTNEVVVQAPAKPDSTAQKDTNAVKIYNGARPNTGSDADADNNDNAPDKTIAVNNTPVSAAPAAPVPANATATPVTAMPDIIAKGTWVIYAQVFPTKHGADMRIKELKNKGFVQARLANANVHKGGNYKVILGAFKTRAEAKDAEKELLATGKLTRDDVRVEQY